MKSIPALNTLSRACRSACARGRLFPRFLLLSAGGLAAAAGLTAWAVAPRLADDSGAAKGAAAARAADLPDGPGALTVHRRLVTRLVESDALIESVQQATLSAEVQARVISVHADAGDRVRKGQLLAVLDARELNAGLGQARAQVAVAQSRVIEARQQLDRTRSLRDKGFVSQAALDQAEAAARAAEAGLEAARAGESMAGVAQGHTRVLAPLDGVVSSRMIEAGDLAQPGRALFGVYQPGALRAVAVLPAGQFHLPAGSRWQVESVRIPALARSLTPPAGAVQVLPAADARDLAQRARVVLGEVPGAVPGMTAKVNWRIDQVERLVVPETVLLRRGEVTLLRVLDSDSRPLLRQVRVGESFAGGWVELLAGAQAGERLAPVAASR